LQPAHLSELSESLGQSTTTTRTQLEKLKRINLVVSTHFEHYTLFCLNGDFNLFFSQLLSAFYEHA
jgi:DNA-binding transcriptional regulator GbsR (MarR family)